jgi:uncharacterized protein (TIGR00369 family)
MDAKPIRKIEYGVTPPEIIASMAGIDFVRATFDGGLPTPPIMQTIEPFDCTAEPGVVVIHSIPAFRHYNPIGSVHGGYAATLLDSAMGLAVHTMLPAGSGYTTLEFKISFIRGMTRGGAIRRPHAQCRPPRCHRRGPHYRRQRPAARACHHDLSGFRDSEGNVSG